MSIAQQNTAFAGQTAFSVALSQVFTVAAGGANPAYLVLTALDRNEYTAGATGAVGSFSGNGLTRGLTAIGGDGRGAGLVFSYQSSTGRYYSSLYGYLDELTFMASASAGDVTNLSWFAAGDLFEATAYANNVYAMMRINAAGYLGSATIVTQPGFSGIIPAQATPNSIAAVANSFVGRAWNMNGCWVLASTIAAEAGASLPVQSTLIGVAGQANGEWIVAFNGPAGQTGDWRSMVTAGEMVVFGTPGGGHITTCVSGSGGTAKLVDNIRIVNSAGVIQNPANDGSASDIIITAPHAAAQEWDGVQASSVVIYQLDTPIVTAGLILDQLTARTSQSLGTLFNTTDPGNRKVSQWQVYNAADGDSLLLNGVACQGHSAASALTTESLAAVSLLAGSTALWDRLVVRAYNGRFWGDWASLAVAVVAPEVVAPVALPPVLTSRTQAQSWLGGSAVSLALPGNAFTDPQGQTLTYTATQSSGQALPSWLGFNAATRTFSGTAPATAGDLGITVTATDTGGLSASERFSVHIQAPPVQPPPVQPPQVRPPQVQRPHVQAPLVQQPAPTQRGIAVSNSTANQTWVNGQSIDVVLPADTFTNALGLRMTFLAYQVAGPKVTSWLHFRQATMEFYGTVPVNASGMVQLEVVASDARHMRALDLFSVTFATASGRSAPSVQTQTSRGAASFNMTPPGVLLAIHA